MRVLIVDDEPLARDLLRALLGRIPDVEVVGEAGDGDSAIEAASRLSPDLIILDIQMPGRDGLQTAFDLKAASERAAPAIIFSTAHADHAVDAFDLEAVDYLLKPIRLLRLRQAIDRVARRQSPAPAANSRPSPSEAVFWIPTQGGRRTRVSEAEIQRIEASRDHVILHTPQRSYFLRTTMAAVAQRLSDPLLVRVHRSAFVRLDAVRSIIRRTGAPALEMLDGSVVPISAQYRAVLARMTGRPTEHELHCGEGAGCGRA